jgi:hypothetical protein
LPFLNQILASGTHFDVETLNIKNGEMSNVYTCYLVNIQGAKYSLIFAGFSPINFAISSLVKLSVESSLHFRYFSMAL